MAGSIEFIDLKSQYLRIKEAVRASIDTVLNHGHYIMGPEVTRLEEKLAAFCHARHVVSCSNGTDALVMVLRALNVGAGDAVFVPTFTFAATAEVVALVGATPVFIDVLPDTFNMDPKSLEEGIQVAKKLNLNPTGIIPVDLFGQPADYQAIQKVADSHQLWVMCDGAQSFGGTYHGKPVGFLGDMTTTSFFPAKPLGCYGDGGAIFVNDKDLAQILQSLRVHGKGSDKYDNVRIGLNGRLDTIQAAILLEKLKIFPDELQKRQQTADYYSERLKNYVQTPVVIEGASSAWAQYTVRLPQSVDRSQVMQRMTEKGVPTMVYYVKPLHQQKAYAHYPTAGHLGVSEALAQDVLSLPMSGYVGDQADRICSTLIESL